MRLPGQTTWTNGVCMCTGSRSCGVQVGDREFWRNCRQLLHTKELRHTELLINEYVQAPVQDQGTETASSANDQQEETQPQNAPHPAESAGPGPSLFVSVYKKTVY